MKKKLPKLFKKRQKSEIESSLAKRYIKKLLSLKITKYFFISLFLLLLLAVFVFFKYKPKIPDTINYGITFSHKYAQDMGMDWQDTYLKILDDLGVKNLRLVAYWDETEAQNNVYDFSNIKWQLDEAQKRDLNIIMAIGRKVPRFPECFEPLWWKNLPAEEQTREHMEYIKTAVDELKGYSTIKMWQIENEPFWPFGHCQFPFEFAQVKKEVEMVRILDSRPILTQDSGEGGVWFKSYTVGDYLGISMYRKIWYDFWGVFRGNFVYFKYPLSNWSYSLKAGILGVPAEKIIVTELQAEPWGPAINSQLSQAEKDKSMSRNDFYAVLSYAQKSGFSDLYLWGAEWWLWEKEVNNNTFFWDTAKALFN